MPVALGPTSYFIDDLVPIAGKHALRRRWQPSWNAGLERSLSHAAAEEVAIRARSPKSFARWNAREGQGLTDRGVSPQRAVLGGSRQTAYKTPRLLASCSQGMPSAPAAGRQAAVPAPSAVSVAPATRPYCTSTCQSQLVLQSLRHLAGFEQAFLVLNHRRGHARQLMSCEQTCFTSAAKRNNGRSRASASTSSECARLPRAASCGRCTRMIWESCTFSRRAA